MKKIFSFFPPLMFKGFSFNIINHPCMKRAMRKNYSDLPGKRDYISGLNFAAM